MSKQEQGIPPVKKGKTSWTPASVTEVTNKEDGYRYRWSNKTPDNLAKKDAEGWENVSKLTNDKSMPSPERIGDGKKLTSVYEKHDVVLQRIPEELAKQRDAYYETETNRRTSGLTAHIKNEIKNKGGNAPIHGDITISSRLGEQKIN